MFIYNYFNPKPPAHESQNQTHTNHNKHSKKPADNKHTSTNKQHKHKPPMSPSTQSVFESLPSQSHDAIDNEDDNTSVRRPIDSGTRYKVVDEICKETNLYSILGVERTAVQEDLRKAYISRSRICHPDKFPEYPKATEAFQKLAYAYETLNKPSTRRAYDISGCSDLSLVNGMGDETLHGVLYQLFLEFMDGDFEMIRALVNALNEGNPNLNLGDDWIENMEHVFGRIRELLLAGKKYIKIVQYELITLYDIQQELRALSYFDVFGRLRLSLQLAKIFLKIPTLIDDAMKAEHEQTGTPGTKGGLLGDGMAKVIAGLVKVLENGEKFV
ncbi:7787_t:CDS:2 [Paraglomus occultum]|uniref:7787_t:CDS:1 n=1 Tax=Paraglomus occultum TaxID=144539 RepID=A0A9N9ADX6_9GLOM|nr:7787_t:CDS:2 [Paraglomus occultum]